MNRLIPFLASASLLVALPLLPHGAALAQGFVGPNPAAGGPAQRQQPAALPGLTARRTPEPIPADPNANLSPTAALFDAVNRGDLAAARDAVNRGASLEERNVLGLTAIDSAVDQGRNDILFYLLSARGAVRGPAAPPDQSPAATRAQRAAQERAAREEAERAARAARAAGATAGRPGRPVVMSPRLFANDGGAARPEVGFLGFDAGRGSGTAPRAGQRRS